jgi:hypothetical protein
MERSPQMPMFRSNHQVVVDAAGACRPGAQVTKRTSIWPGGLSTAGGEFPS